MSRERGTSVARRTALLVAFALSAVLLILLWHGADRDASTATTAREDGPTIAPLADVPVLPELPDVATPAAAPILADDSSAAARMRAREWTASTWPESLGENGDRARCTLIVLDELERPVPGASVQVWGEEQSPITSGGTDTPRVVLKSFPSIGPLASVTDAAGLDVITPPRHSPSVLVEKAGVGCSGWVSLEQGRTQIRELVVPLHPPTRILGRVLRANGEPAPRASLRVTSTRAPGAPPRVPPELQVDDEGRFELLADDGARLSFIASEGGATTPPRSVTARAGSNQELLLRLPGAFYVRGTLQRPAGAPEVELADGLITLVPDRPYAEVRAELGDTRCLRTAPDRDGAFELTLPQPVSGRLLARIDAWGLERAGRLELGAAPTESEITLQLAPPEWISGRLVDAGAPLTGIEVRCNSAMGSAHDDGPIDVDLNGSTKAMTDESGAFRLGPLRATGLYDLFATVGEDDGKRHFVARGVRPGTRNVDLGAAGARDASISVIAVASATGKPLEDVSAYGSTLDGDGGWMGASYFGKSSLGVRTLDGLAPGSELCVIVSCSGYGSVATRAVATVEGTGLRVELPALAALDLSVEDGGEPAAWAVVGWTVQRPSCAGRPRPLEGRERADAAGRVKLDRLEPGHYTFTVTRGERSQRREIELAPGTPATLDVDLH